MAGICRDQHPQEQISSSDWLSSLFLWKTTHQYKEFVNKVSTVSLSVPQKGTSVGITVLDNNTSIKELLERVAMDFSAMFRRKAYLHLYLNEGMDEEEFKEAESLLNEVISKYTEAEELIRQQNLTSEETSEDMEE
jgi:tubulin beta